MSDPPLAARGRVRVRHPRRNTSDSTNTTSTPRRERSPTDTVFGPRGRSITGGSLTDSTSSGSRSRSRKPNKRRDGTKNKHKNKHRHKHRSKKVGQHMTLPDFDKLPPPKNCCETYSRFIHKQGLQIPDAETENEYLATTHTTTANRLSFTALSIAIGIWFIVIQAEPNVGLEVEWVNGTTITGLGRPTHSNNVALVLIRLLVAFSLTGAIILGLSTLVKIHKCVAIASQVRYLLLIITSLAFPSASSARICL